MNANKNKGKRIIQTRPNKTVKSTYDDVEKSLICVHLRSFAFSFAVNASTPNL